MELFVLTKALVFLVQAGIGTCQLMSWNRVWIGGADCTGPCNGLMVKTPSFVRSGAGESTGCSARQWSTGESCSSHASSWLPSASACGASCGCNEAPCGTLPVADKPVLQRLSFTAEAKQHLKMIMNLGDNIVKEAKNMVDSLWCCSEAPWWIESCGLKKTTLCFLCCKLDSCHCDIVNAFASLFLTCVFELMPL